MGDLTVVKGGLFDLDPSTNPFQSDFWAHVKEYGLWSPLVLRVLSHTGKSIAILVLVRRFAGNIPIAYIPFAPPLDVFAVPPADLLSSIAEQAKPHLPKHTIYLRFDLPWQTEENCEMSPLFGQHLRICKNSVQPEATVRLDLHNGYEQVCKHYRQRAKRNIRKAEQSGIDISEWDGDNNTFDQWYAVYQFTAKRDGFTARQYDYLKRWLTFTSTVVCHLYLAKQNQRVIGGIIVMESRYVAVYVFGASISINEISCSYLLQDYAIKAATGRGCQIYDLYGIEGPKDRSSHLKGLGFFKRAFGSSIYYRHPTIDYVYRPCVRSVYVLLENMQYAAKRKFRRKNNTET